MLGYNNRVKSALNTYIIKHFKHLPEYFSTANFSKHLNTPCLIIHDKKDRIIPYTDALDIYRNYKNAKLVSTKGYGHGLKSKEVNNTILDFLSA